MARKCTRERRLDPSFRGGPDSVAPITRSTAELFGARDLPCGWMRVPESPLRSFAQQPIHICVGHLLDEGQRAADLGARRTGGLLDRFDARGKLTYRGSL